MKDFEEHINTLRSLGLRPTKQRIKICEILFGKKATFHFTVNQLNEIYKKKFKSKISLATIYNTVHGFKKKGYLKEITLDGNKSYYDTNTLNHHHFYDEGEDKLIDIENFDVSLNSLPKAPLNKSIKSVELMIRLENNNHNQK